MLTLSSGFTLATSFSSAGLSKTTFAGSGECRFRLPCTQDKFSAVLKYFSKIRMQVQGVSFFQSHFKITRVLTRRKRTYMRASLGDFSNKISAFRPTTPEHFWIQDWWFTSTKNLKPWIRPKALGYFQRFLRVSTLVHNIINLKYKFVWIKV